MYCISQWTALFPCPAHCKYWYNLLGVYIFSNYGPVLAPRSEIAGTLFYCTHNREFTSPPTSRRIFFSILQHFVFVHFYWWLVWHDASLSNFDLHFSNRIVMLSMFHMLLSSAIMLYFREMCILNIVPFFDDCLFFWNWQNNTLRLWRIICFICTPFCG